MFTVYRARNFFSHPQVLVHYHTKQYSTCKHDILQDATVKLLTKK